MEDEKQDMQNGLSRREFLKDAGLVIGGAALVSLALSSACKNTDTASPATSSSETPATTPPGTSTATTSASAEPTSTRPLVTLTADIIVSPPPYLIPTPGCTSKVAPDRLYSLNHIWVNKLGSDTVLIGMTDKFQTLTGLVYNDWLSPPGAVLKAGESFGSVEASKINVDLLSPVSGRVIETNIQLMTLPQPINGDPYTYGWMLKIQLSNTAELDNLVAPMYYNYLQALGWTGPVPPMH